MPFEEDLSVFINDDTPGYASVTIGVDTIGGLFDNGYGEFGGVVGGSNPSLLCISSEASAVVNGSALTVNGVNYIVSGAPQPDGTGMTRIELRLA